MSELLWLACVEQGPLEPRAVLLARSIRRFGGRWAEAPLRLYHPSPHRPLAADTRAELAREQVEIFSESINPLHERLPRTNKVFACAHAEATCDARVLVFLDTDTLVTAEPIALDLAPGIDLAARPVDSVNIGSRGLFDRRDRFWRRARTLCRAPSLGWVRTTIGQRRIRAYFNSGLVALRREAGLGELWRLDLERLVDAGHLPPVADDPRIGRPFVDQVALAMAAAHARLRRAILPASYNYALPKRPLMPAPLDRIPWGDLVHVHYHRSFEHGGRGVPDDLRHDSPVWGWLEPQLAELFGARDA